MSEILPQEYSIGTPEHQMCGDCGTVHNLRRILRLKL